GDFDFSFKTIKTRLGANGIAIQYPIGQGHQFQGIIDLVTMRAFYFDASEQGAVVTEKDIPEDLKETAKHWHHKLVEGAAEMDDHLTEKYLTDENSITPDEIRAALRKGTIARKCYPVLCGAALRNIGVQKLLDAVIEYLPAPSEVPPVEGVNPRDPEQ